MAIAEVLSTIVIRSLAKKLVRLAWKFIKWFFIFSILSVVIFRFIPIPLTPHMIWNLPFQIIDPSRKLRLKKDWESIENISPHLKKAVVAAEDQKFYSHNGFDFEAIKKAYMNNEKGKRIKGGSTISQQTAKNVFLTHHRNYIRKGLEAYFTILIELIWSKERILEVYLNVVEFGDGVYGAEAASLNFFNKSSSNLTREEAALMAIVLPNPLKYKISQPSRFMKRRQRWCLRQMKNL